MWSERTIDLLNEQGSHKTFIKRYTEKTPKAFFRMVNRNLQWILRGVEGSLMKGDLKPRWAPIFITGLPRAGTTLVYQALVRGLALSYFCNLAADFELSPGAMTTILACFTKITPPVSFSSYYGDTAGWRAPSQGLKIWARWFPGQQAYFGPGQLSGAQLKELRGTIALVERAFGMPFINKTQGHSERMLTLAEAFPNLLFINVRRNYLQIAQSILCGRKEYWGDSTHWFSVRPKNYDAIKDHESIRQICEQIYYLEKDMQYSISKLDGKKVFEVEYEEFCRYPQKTLNSFIEFYQRNTGYRLSSRGEVPISFEPSNKIRISEQEYSALKKCLLNFFPDMRMLDWDNQSSE